MTALELDGRRLDALPTRDALIVPITLLLLARRDGVPLSQLATLLPPRFTASQRLQNFPTELSSRHIGRLAEHRAAIVEQFPSLGRVTDIDRTDGLRVTFENDEVVHLRPSGNAPELRCYTEADSAARAQALNAECLGLLDAWRE
jgi:phosphomannomutase